MSHVDDPSASRSTRALLIADAPPLEAKFDERRRRLLTMLGWGLASGAAAQGSLTGYFDSLWRESAVRAELLELLGVLDARSRTRAATSVLPAEIPLTLHARYSRQEIIAALGYADGVKPKVARSVAAA